MKGRKNGKRELRLGDSPVAIREEMVDQPGRKGLQFEK